MGEKLGLVFSGGGTKGSFEIGVWTALRELGIDSMITGVSASSIGSYNTAMFAQGNLEVAIDVWKNFTKSDFMNLNYEMIFQKFMDSLGCKPKDVLLQNIRMVETAQNAVEMVDGWMDEFKAGELTIAENKRDYAVWFANNLFGDGFATPDKLLEILQTNVDLDYVLSKDMDLFSTICEWDNVRAVSGDAQYVSWKGLTKAEVLSLIATSMALPVLYPHGEKGGSYFVDGGYADNVPIKPLYDAGYRNIIVVYLEKFEEKGAMEKRLAKEAAEFPDANLIRIFPNKKFDDSFSKACTISPKKTLEYLQMGYQDAMMVFRALAGDAEEESIDLGDVIIEKTEPQITKKEQKKLDKLARKAEKAGKKLEKAQRKIEQK